MSKIYKSQSPSGMSAEPLVMEELKGSHAARPFSRGGDLALSAEREAYEKGFQTGEKAGFEFGRKKAEAVFKGIDSLLSELTRFKESLYSACENEVTDLALAIAKKVIHRDANIRGEIVLDSVKAALKAVVATSEVLIKVNPKDIEIIRQHKGDLLRYADGVKNISFEADDSIGRGGCVIETNYGEIDATISAILAEIEEKLKNAG